MKPNPRLLRITTVPISLKLLLKGQLSFFKENGFEVLAVSADGAEVADIVKERIPHRVVPMTRKITPLADLISLFKLIAVIREFKPDIVHTHTPKAGLLGMLAAFFCRVPVRMHTVAGLPLMERTGLTKIILILAERLTYVCATRVYPNSNALRSYIKTFAPNARLSVIGKGSSNGIDTRYFKPSDELYAEARSIRNKHGIKEHAVVFCFVGRLVKDKGIHELVYTFQRLREVQPHPIHLLLVGDFEPELDPLDKSIYEFLQNDQGVTLAGFRSDVRPWILAADIFVFPSYREGFPNVVMQACCLGIPCIVSDINGCNEIITHEQTGLVVKPKSIDSLFNAMSDLLSNERKRIEFGEKSRAYVIDNYDQKLVWEALLREYKAHLNDKE